LILNVLVGRAVFPSRFRLRRARRVHLAVGLLFVVRYRIVIVNVVVVVVVVVVVIVVVAVVVVVVVAVKFPLLFADIWPDTAGVTSRR